MIRTLPLDELKKDSKTIYEAVEVISKRARQITSIRRAKIEVFDGIDDQIEDNFDDLNINIETQLYEKKDKPTRQAIEEMLGGKLKFKYPEQEKETSVE
jgi:DNA-directed RNA polymerase subunit K/omega